jgi:hypothetical protein
MFVKETTELLRLRKLQSAGKKIECLFFKIFVTLSTDITSSADDKIWTEKLGSVEVKQRVVWTIP